MDNSRPNSVVVYTLASEKSFIVMREAENRALVLFQPLGVLRSHIQRREGMGEIRSYSIRKVFGSMVAMRIRTRARAIRVKFRVAQLRLNFSIYTGSSLGHIIPI